MRFSFDKKKRPNMLSIGDMVDMNPFRSTHVKGGLQFTITLALLATLASSGCSRSPEQPWFVQTVKTSLGMFQVDCGRYPTTAEGLRVLLETPNGSSITNWKGPYLDKSTELKDRWGHEYVYSCPGIHNTDGYDLYSLGPDGKDNTGDEIGNWVAEPDLQK
jgi:type II secretion system protein G